MVGAPLWTVAHTTRADSERATQRPPGLASTMLVQYALLLADDQRTWSAKSRITAPFERMWMFSDLQLIVLSEPCPFCHVFGCHSHQG